MKYYVTLTGLNYRFGTQPFTVGQKVKLVKEPENDLTAKLSAQNCRVWVRWVMCQQHSHRAGRLLQRRPHL